MPRATAQPRNPATVKVYLLCLAGRQPAARRRLAQRSNLAGQAGGGPSRGRGRACSAPPFFRPTRWCSRCLVWSTVFHASGRRLASIKLCFEVMGTLAAIGSSVQRSHSARCNTHDSNPGLHARASTVRTNATVCPSSIPPAAAVNRSVWHQIIRQTPLLLVATEAPAPVAASHNCDQRAAIAAM